MSEDRHWLGLVTPLVRERHAALRQSVLALRHVLDLDLVEREAHPLEDVRAAGRRRRRRWSSEITRPCSIVIFRYSSWPLPAFRSVSTAFWIGSFVRSASINAVEALSTRLTILSSLMVAFPVAVPPPSVALACMPHDQLRTSISPLCCVVLRLPLDQAVLGALDHQEHVAGAAAHESRSSPS